MTASPPAAPVDRLVLAKLLRGTGKEFESTVQGHSMRGTLPEGAQIRIRCDAHSPLQGQVVAFVMDNELVAHRVVANGNGVRAARYLITSGDASVVCDAPVPQDSVVGVVTGWRLSGDWLPVAGAPARRGWRLGASQLMLAAVRAALEADVRFATALVDVALFGRRLRAAARGTPGHRAAAGSSQRPGA